MMEDFGCCGNTGVQERPPLGGAGQSGRSSRYGEGTDAEQGRACWMRSRTGRKPMWLELGEQEERGVAW